MLKDLLKAGVIVMKDNRILIVAILLFIFLPSLGCVDKTPEYGAFYTAGTWDIPPAFHGNPWAPGGENVTNHYIYEPLFMYNPSTGRYTSRLGIHFEESADYKTLTVTLNGGVTWHDGEPFTSRDVQTTFRLGYLRNWNEWRNLDRIECPNDFIVVFHWKTPAPSNKVTVLTRPISSPYHIFGEWSDKIPQYIKERGAISLDDIDAFEQQSIKERDVREVLFQYRPSMPIGTGPFKIANVTASDILLLKYEDHYESINVHIDKVRIMRWAGNEVVWSYLIAGEIDAAAPACPYDVAQEILRRNPRTRLITPNDLSEFGLIYNCRKLPGSNLSFRKAVAHILDREGVRQVAYYYGDTVGDYSLGVPKSFRHRWLDEDFLQDLTLYDHNPLKAEQLLQRAGFYRHARTNWWHSPDGEEINLEIVAPQGLSDLVLLGEAAAAQLTRAGIKAQIRQVPKEIFITSLREGNFDLACENGAQLTRYGDPGISFNRFYAAGDLIQTAAGLPEEAQYKEQTVNTNDLIKELNTTMDQERRNEIIRMLAWITNERLPFISCYEKKIMIFTTSQVRVSGWPDENDEIWGAAPSNIENLFCTMIVKGLIKPDSEQRNLPPAQQGH